MNIRKRFIAILMCLVTVIIFIQPKKVQAEIIKDYDIISDCEVTVKQAKEWAKVKNATQTFIDLADLYWKYAEECGGVNPAIAYAQAAKETGYGNFGGVLDESYCNPCGLKTEQGGDDNDPDAHEEFDSWDEGVQAHLDHLALYAGAKGYPKSKTFDPRHFQTVKGRCITINELGGANKWAPSETYGQEVNALYRSLLLYAGIEKEEVNQSESQSIKPAAITSLPVNIDVNNNINISSNLGWKNESGNWCYYKNDNTKAIGWINPDGNWYYISDSGNMLTGWVKYGQSWYYLNQSGAMARGWKQIDNSWYYLQGDGSMVTGLRNIDGKNYYLNDSGSMIVGWLDLSGDKYYFTNDGSMVTNTTIDGFKIGADGRREENKTNDSNKVTVDDKNNSSLPDADEENERIIVVDPGHAYGKDEGVKTTIDGVDYSETELNMEVAEKLKKELEKRGFSVLMTRSKNQKFSDLDDSLSHRVDVANRANAEFYISIHHNAVDGIPTASGVETYYSVAAKDDNYGGDTDNIRLEKSKEIAKLINDNIVKKLNANNRGIKTDKESASGSLFVLRNTNMPAVLVETGFLSNEDEAERCADSDSQQIVAEAIAEVIANNF